MPLQSHQFDYDAISTTKADVLRLLCRHFRPPEIAECLGLSLSTIKRHMAELGEITGYADAGALARWWEEHRIAWLQRQAERAGIDWQKEIA